MDTADAAWIAAHTDDWSGAELAGLCDDAATTVLARRFPGWPDSIEEAADDTADVRGDWKDSLYRREQSTRLGAPPPLRRPLPKRVAPLLAPTLADVRAFLIRHFPVQRLRSVPGRCAAAAAVGCGADTGFRALTKDLPILPQRLLIDGDEGMCPGTIAGAVLHALTPNPIYDAGFVSLSRGAGARTPQQRLAETVYAATCAAPAVVFIPHADLWVDDPSAGDSTDSRVFEAALRDVPVAAPLLVLATTDGRARPALLASFPSTFSVKCATDAQRRDYGAHIVKACLEKFAVKRGPNVRLPVNMNTVHERLEALQTQSAEWSVDAMEQVFDCLRALLCMQVVTGVDLWASLLTATVALDGKAPSVGANKADGVASDDTHNGGGGGGGDCAADGSRGRPAKRLRGV